MYDISVNQHFNFYFDAIFRIKIENVILLYFVYMLYAKQRMLHMQFCAVCGKNALIYDTYVIFDNVFCSRSCRDEIIKIYQKERKLWKRDDYKSVRIGNCVIDLLFF